MLETPHSGQYKTYRVLYVTDPSRERDKNPCGDLGWFTRNITLGQYNSIKALRRSCFVEVPQPRDMPNDTIRVEIMEWVSTPIPSINIYLDH